MGIYQGCQPLLKGGLACLGGRGLERLCSTDQFASWESGGRRITLIFRSLREGGWRDLKRGRNRRAFSLGKLDWAPMGRKGRAPEDKCTGPFSWRRDGAGREHKAER